MNHFTSRLILDCVSLGFVLTGLVCATASECMDTVERVQKWRFAALITVFVAIYFAILAK